MANDKRLRELVCRFEELDARGEQVTPESICHADGCPELADELRRQLLIEDLVNKWHEASDSGGDPEQATQFGDAPTEVQAAVRQRVASHRLNEESLLHEEIEARIEEWEISGRDRSPANLCASSPDLVPEVERRIAQETQPIGRFRLIRRIGKGGLGEVFLAEDTELRRPVALKRMQRWLTGNAKERQRFLIEAEVASRLEHPGIVPIYELVREGEPWYAMRLYPPRTLKTAIVELHGATRSPEEFGAQRRELLRHFLAVCEAIAFAHHKGFIHRDLKPANILLGEFGETLVADWGLVKIVRAGSTTAEIESASRSTSPYVTGRGKGTAGFMSPEQARGNEVTPASDIYSLGAILFNVLTGHDPGQRTSASTSSVPRALLAACRKAMAIEPAERYASAKDFAADVERWLADEPVSAWREPWSVQARRWLKRHRTWAIAGAAALLVLTFSTTLDAIVLAAKNRELEKETNEKGILNDRLILESSKLAAESKAKGILNQQLLEEKAKLADSHGVTQRNFDLATRSIATTAALVNVRLPGGQAVADPIRNAINTEARDYYRRFIANNDKRPELLNELAFAHLRQAEAEIGLNNESAAAPLLAEARRRFEAILALAPDNLSATYGLGCVEMHATIVLIHQLKANEARATSLRACQLLAGVCRAKRPADWKFKELESPAIKLAQAAVALRDVEARTDPRQELPFFPSVSVGDDGRVLPFAKLAEEKLSEERKLLIEFPIEARAIHGLLLLCLSEELAIRDRYADAQAALEKARIELATVIKEYPTAYEIEMSLYIVDFYRALAAHDKRSVSAVRQMTEVRDRFRELANRPWGPDRFAVQNRTKMFAAAASKTLARWAMAAGDARRAQQLYHEAFDELNKIEFSKGDAELSTRIPLLTALAEVLDGLKSLEGDDDKLRKIIERYRAEFIALEPTLKHVPWFQRERLFADTMMGFALCVAMPPDPRALPMLVKATVGLQAFSREHPDDSLASFQYAVARMQYGMGRALLADQIEEGLKDLAQAGELMAKYPADGPKAPMLPVLLRLVAAQTITLHCMRAEQLLMPKHLDRQKAREHIEAGLAGLVKLEKAGPLTELDKQVRQGLEQLQQQLRED